ncbi:MAG: hypothetical protein HY561_08675 [Gemmatimonadetes bacterium]|nr:hypothetical protein [Gemmatimonadota bacterium]
MTRHACIGGIACAFPRETRTLPELARAGLLESDPEVLARFGFERVHIATCETPFELALAAARDVLQETDTDPDDVDLLLYGGTPGIHAFTASPDPAQASKALRTSERFQYPAARLQYELGLGRAAVIGLDQLACTTLLAAVRVARALCLADGVRRALCVASEFYPADAGREALFNCTSDAACALLVEADGARNRIVAATHVTKGYYWECDALRNEIVASYFPTARHVIERTLAEAGWAADEVDWVIPHNVSRRSWDILLGLVRLPRARLWDANIARRGHTLAGDNFINLRDALAAGDIQPGQKLLLFSYGYGAHWTGLALES